MFEVEINGKTLNASVTFMTALIYEEEFGTDMLKDFLGVLGSDSANKIGGEGDVVTVDFTKTNWSVALKVLWASLKTVDESLPGYKVWVKSAEGANLWLINDLLGDAVVDCFFRTEVARQED